MEGAEQSSEQWNPPSPRTFQGNDHRAGKMSLETEGLFLDYSKNRITDETLALLLKLAEDTGLREKIDAMFGGEKINITENRAVLHVALRAPAEATIMVDGQNVVPGVHEVLKKCLFLPIRCVPVNGKDLAENR
jgi:glucose-6-phosphate isomerase